MNHNQNARAADHQRAHEARPLALALVSLLSMAGCANLDEPAGYTSDLSSGPGALGGVEMVHTWSDEASPSYESIVAEAGEDLIVNDDPAIAGVGTGMVERGTYYLRDGNIAARVEVSATEVRVQTFVRGGARATHGVSISAQCELVPHFYTNKELELGDTVIARCAPDYPVEHATIGIIDMSTSTAPSEAVADSFEEIRAEAGDDVREHNIPGQIGSHSDNMQRGTVYLLDGDVIAKVVVTATETTVNTYVRGGGRAPHDVAISQACEFVGPWTVAETLDYGGTVVSRCTADYPIANTIVSLGTHTE